MKRIANDRLLFSINFNRVEYIMKKIFFLFSFLIIGLSLTIAQDFNLTGAGARAEGLGGAFIGVADDATAIVWNPAGLTQLERAEASVVTRFISEKVDYKFEDSSGPDNLSESQSHFSFNFGSFAAPLSTGDVKIVAAVAFQRQLDMYSKDKAGTESKGGANTITPGIAITLGEMMSIGASANIWTGTWNSSINTPSAFDMNFTGFNFVIGGLIDFERKSNGFPLKAGVTMRTPFTLKGEVQNVPSSVTWEINMPFMIGFGGSYRVGDNLTLALDYEIRSYKDKQMTITSFEPITYSKHNLNEFRGGLEYLVVLETAVIPLRFGFKTVPTFESDQLASDDGINYVYSDTDKQVTGSAFAIGSGFITNAFAFDITYSRATATQKIDYSAYPSVTGSNELATGTLSTSVIIYF